MCSRDIKRIKKIDLVMELLEAEGEKMPRL